MILADADEEDLDDLLADSASEIESETESESSNSYTSDKEDLDENAFHT